MKKTVIMDINQTIKRIEQTANLKVIGIKIATPLTEPRPGIAPTNKPMRHPNIKRAKFNNSKDVAIP